MLDDVLSRNGSDALCPDPRDIRFAAIAAAARFHGIDLDRSSLKVSGVGPSAAELATWLGEQGLWARAVTIGWRRLVKLSPETPVVLLLDDGGAGLLVATDPARDLVWLRDPCDSAAEPEAIDRLRLSQSWSGEMLLIRRGRDVAESDEAFGFRWIARLVLLQRQALIHIAIASLVMSILAVVPALLTSIVLDRVLVYQSWSTLTLVSVMVGTAVLFEALLSHARGDALQVLSTRIDARLNIHVFNRLLMLPLDYFERHPTGETNHRVAQVYRVRAFLTGKVMGTVLDTMTLLVLLPVVFWLQPALAAMVLAASAFIAGVIAVFLPSMRRAHGHAIAAEMRKNATLVETVHGIRTVKSLALEPAKREAWDLQVAAAGRAQIAAGRLGRWPRTLTLPAERFIDRGVLLIAAVLVLSGEAAIQPGALVSFVMLSGRLAAPLIGLARLLEDLEEARTSVDQVAEVLNNPTEARAMREGLRPRLAGRLHFDNVVFTYPSTLRPALNQVSFEVPPGTMLGLVGRSGSGKSTVTRLLQGISREYGGMIRVDGTDLREINLAHLRRSIGIVLQDNVLFRGTVCDNILAGRPNLTLDDAIEAARLAGADEFIERLPKGYDSLLEEGSSNLSGGQRQRLAIARAIVTDPQVLILDEATSALDPESEAVVNANLLRVARGRTVVIVSHRLSSLLDCDQIAVLDEGRLLDIAPHPELLRSCDVYRALWHQQNRHLAREGASCGS